MLKKDLQKKKKSQKPYMIKQKQSKRFMEMGKRSFYQQKS